MQIGAEGICGPNFPLRVFVVNQIRCSEAAVIHGRRGDRSPIRDIRVIRGSPSCSNLRNPAYQTFLKFLRTSPRKSRIDDEATNVSTKNGF